ncbi:MAG: hypothetical protein ACLFWL_04615 [Candidatus Brocadiia bacterium]
MATRGSADLGRTETAIAEGDTAMARILIFEDEEDLQLLYRENLSQLGYKVLTAGDGVQALDSPRTVSYH